jgi:hypothetical protein
LGGMKLRRDVIDRIELFAGMDVYMSKYAKAESGGDFDDLGRSERLKGIEKEYEKAVEDGSINDEDTADIQKVESFEKQWFYFLIE